MVIDYSKWDKLTFESESDDDEGGVQANKPTPVRVLTPSSANTERTCTDTHHIPIHDIRRVEGKNDASCIIFVNSRTRSNVLSQMHANGLTEARSTNYDRYGIVLPCQKHNEMVNFFGVTPADQLKLVAALFQMTPSKYLEKCNYEDVPMETVPYDYQESNIMLTDGTRLVVKYGQENQPLYQKLAGPEMKQCKEGAGRGGPAVFHRSTMLMDSCKCGGMNYEYEQIESIKDGETTLVQAVVGLLEQASIAY